MKSSINTILFVLIFQMSLFAQKTSISGKISNQDKKAVIGANVTLKGTVRGVQSNQNGDYIIKSIPAGEYTLVVSNIGLKTQEVSVKITENETIKVDFQMEDFSNLLNGVDVISNRGVRGNEHLAEVEGFSIFATKKNEDDHYDYNYLWCS